MTATPTPTASSAEPTVQPRLRYVFEPDFIAQGECFTLSWTGQNVTNVIVQGNPKPLQGSETFRPTTTTNYTLTSIRSLPTHGSVFVPNSRLGYPLLGTN